MIDPKDDGLFSDDEKRLLQSVRRSKMWRLIQEALVVEREGLFSEEPKSTEELWRNRGRLEEVQRLLHQGPLLVVFYQRSMRERELERELERRERDFTRGPFDSEE